MKSNMSASSTIALIMAGLASFSAQADVRGVNIQPALGGNRFDVVVRDRDGGERTIEGVSLPMSGRHNVQNALAAIAVALHMGCSDDVVCNGFANFDGVKRRFTKVGQIACGDGCALVIDDYAHHPVEIRAVLSAAREGLVGQPGGRVIAVVQPHRFSRLGDLMDEFRQAFNDADAVYALPVYAAGEDPIEGINSEALVAGLRDRGHHAAYAVASPEDLAERLSDEVKAGDFVVCLGAGDITRTAAGLADAIHAVKTR